MLQVTSRMTTLNFKEELTTEVADFPGKGAWPRDPGDNQN